VSDEEMILAIKSHDGAAIHMVITKYSRLLYKIAVSVLCGAGCEADAEECVADVFIALWERPEAYEAGRGTLKSWLCIMARSKAIDRYRYLTRNSMVPIESIVAADAFSVQEQVIRKETYHDLVDAVAALEKEERDILLRRYVSEQKPKVIARALGLTVKQVNNSLYRIKRKLRQILTQKEGEPL